jgi:hypothetical protein
MRIWIAATALACASGASAQMVAPAPPPTAREASATAAQIASVLQQQAPLDLGNGIRATSIHSEGTLVVWTIDVPAAIMEGHSAADAAAPLMIGFCSGDNREIFASGVSIRIDIGVAGAAPVRGQVISSCPDA